MTQRISNAEPSFPSPEERRSPETGARPALAVRIVLVGLVPLTLLYLILTHSVPLGLSRGAPEAALFFRRDYPAAVATLADRAIALAIKERQDEARNTEKTDARSNKASASLPEVEATLKRGILRRPLDAQAFRQLGQIADLEGDPAKSQRFMETAVKLSPHEPTAYTNLMLKALSQGKYKTALYYADLLMRSSTSGAGYAIPLVLRLVDYPPAREELVRLLATAPPWRASLLASLPGAPLADPNAPSQLLRALRKTRNPPTPREVDAYLTFLFNKKLYQQAYQIWLEFLPPDQTEDIAYLFNGGFEWTPSGSPFNWKIGQGADAKAAILAREDKENSHALAVVFGEGRVTLPQIRQTMVLPPGNYRFKGHYKGELRARRGLQWRVSCTGGAVAGESEMLVGIAPEWREFSFDFSIPRGNCPAQDVDLVHMARSPSEQLATGSMWFDDLAVTRILDNAPSDQ